MVNELFRKIVRHAYETVPYYKKAFDEYAIDILSIKASSDLPGLPVLNKEAIQKSPEAFLSSDFKYFPGRERLTINWTSGSTGKILKIYWAKQDMIRSLFHLWVCRTKNYNVGPQSKICSFHTTVFKNNRLIMPEDVMYFNAKRNISFSKMDLSEKKLEEYYERMSGFKPEWLFVQPSIAYLLANFISKNNLEPVASLKYIELTGEYLFDSYRKRIKEVFNVPVANMYGANEANGIAMECPEGNLHCLGLNTIVEVLKDGKPASYGEEGEIYITSLTNYAMPFIRYALGDRAILHPYQTCGCGNKNPVIKVLAGRISDDILLDNRQVSSFVFVYAVERVNTLLGKPILQFKILQESINEFTALFVLENSFTGWKQTVCREFVTEMNKLGFAGGIAWKFEFLEEIRPDAGTGKLQFFANRIKKVNCPV